ncbi:cytochrome b5 reductase 4-like [Tropilaelaps mercedesae]|uniref:Cytochrome b5 reductase 4-like n=1 Tax=Tropilaelaps mercedesae TaxID=418985 RepID=A0A1V9XQG4_9ACAR|nr:cytochrome b5 reductase 4-like [Tropilaelaps mercedesae]
MASGEAQTATITSNATGSGRNKVALAPGHSLIDWIKLAHKEDLAGTGGKTLRVTPEELEKHCTPDDAWICIKALDSLAKRDVYQRELQRIASTRLRKMDDPRGPKVLKQMARADP